MNITGWRAYGVVVLRVGIGLGMVYHGWQMLFDKGEMARMAGFVGKLGFPAPLFFAYCAKLSEFAGGIFLVLGAFTRPAALFIGFTMFVAAFVANAGEGFEKKEKALLYLLGAVAVFLTGPGPCAADPWIRSFWAGWKQRRRERKRQGG